MKFLIVEDEFVSRSKLLKILSNYGECNVAIDGHEALRAFQEALADNDPYDLICLDIMMPKLDGHETLQEIRRMEEEKGIGGVDHVKVVMTSALSDAKNIMKAFMRGQCEAYLAKPINRKKLEKQMEELGLIEQQEF